ncbi:MAG TPA: hypothetical protein VEQ60_27090 [Longimicrobium sp.]|nr:hypothetical protein [Longimicrobium sp.]
MSAPDAAPAGNEPPRATPGQRARRAGWLLLSYGIVMLFGGHGFAPLVLVLAMPDSEFLAIAISGWAGVALLAASVFVPRPDISRALFIAAIASLALSIVLGASWSEIPPLTLVTALPFLALGSRWIVRTSRASAEASTTRDTDGPRGA